MSPFAAFLMGLEMLRRNKLRAFLTMLGVIIGVMSVTLIVMVSGGFQSFIQGEFAKIGSRTILVFFDPGRKAAGETTGPIEGLKMPDLDFVRERVPEAELVVPMASYGSMRADAGDNHLDDAKPNASTADYFELNGIELLSGRLFTPEDNAGRRNVAVIGEEVAARLFGKGQAVGKLVSLPGITLEVVGVMKAKTLLGQNNGKDLVLPIETCLYKWQGDVGLGLMMIRPKASVPVERAMDSIWRTMMLRSGNKPIYRVDSNESIAKVFGAILGGAGAVLAGIAALSLLVGGIGIMNIMLVSVTERTREIGLRKALGAKRGAILTQFLVEAATLSLVGGLIGMGLAYLLGFAVTFGTAAAKVPNENGLTTPFPLTAALLATVFSAGIGVLFGLYPALSASRLDPIVALRRE